MWIQWQGCCDFCITGGVQGQNHHDPLLFGLHHLLEDEEGRKWESNALVTTC